MKILRRSEFPYGVFEKFEKFEKFEIAHTFIPSIPLPKDANNLYSLFIWNLVSFPTVIVNKLSTSWNERKVKLHTQTQILLQRSFVFFSSVLNNSPILDDCDLQHIPFSLVTAAVLESYHVLKCQSVIVMFYSTCRIFG